MAQKQIDQLAEKNRRYWAIREEEALQHYIKDEKQYDRQIQSIYKDILDNIQKEIDGFYGRYAGKEGISINEAKKRVTEADIKAYERKAKRYVKEKDFSKQANEEMRLYNLTMKVNRLELLKANIGLDLVKGHDELDKYIEEILQGRTMEEIQRQAGILGNTITINSKMAHAIPNSSFHNATFSDRIWMHQSLLKADLSKLLQTGLIQGKNPRVLAREIERRFNTSRYNAERLMRTELARVQIEVQKASLERNGFTQFEFLANSGCCDICQEKNRKIFKLDGFKYGDNAPPIHPHCRCTIAPYEDTTEFNAWLDHVGSGGGTTWADWKSIALDVKNKRLWDDDKLSFAQKAKKIKDEIVEIIKVQKMKSVDDCGTMSELVKYFEIKHSIKADSAITGLDFGSVKNALSGVETLMTSYEDVKKYYNKIGITNEGLMCIDPEDKSIKLNPRYFSNREYLEKIIRYNIEVDNEIKNATPASVGVHEVAHLLEMSLIEKSGKYSTKKEIVDAWSKCIESEIIVREALVNVRERGFGVDKTDNALLCDICENSAETMSEALADSFEDVFANGDNANVLSMEIMRLTIKKLRDYEVRDYEGGIKK